MERGDPHCPSIGARVAQGYVLGRAAFYCYPTLKVVGCTPFLLSEQKRWLRAEFKRKTKHIFAKNLWVNNSTKLKIKLSWCRYWGCDRTSQWWTWACSWPWSRWCCPEQTSSSSWSKSWPSRRRPRRCSTSCETKLLDMTSKLQTEIQSI